MKKFFNFSWLNKNILGFGLASFFSDMAHETALGLLPAFLTTLVGAHNAPQSLGIIMGISEIVATFFKLISGFLSDYCRVRKLFIVAGYALEGFFIGIWGWVTSWKMIIGTQAMGWLGKGIREPSRDALISESINRKYYGRAFGWQRALDTLGALVGPLIGFFLLKVVSLRTIFLLTFIPSLLSVLAIVVFTQESLPSVQKDNNDPWWHYLFQFPSSFYYFAIIIFVFSCAHFNKTFFMLHAQNSLAIHYHFMKTAGFVLLLYSLFSAVRLSAEYTLGFLSDFVGRIFLLSIFGFGLFGVVTVLLTLLTPTLGLYFVIFTLAAISEGAVKTLTKATAADFLDHAPRATGYGLITMLEGVGSLLANLAMGTVWTYGGSTIAFLYGALISFAIMVTSFVIMKTKNVKII